MPRHINSVGQHLDANGNPYSGGGLYFFNSGTSTQKITYSDELLTTPNAHPVVLDSAGREPDIYYSGSAKVILKDASANQIWESDPVTAELISPSPYDLYESTTTYDLYDRVRDSGGKYYQSLSGSNLNNSPSTSPLKWTEISALKVWNTNVVYVLGEVVQDSVGQLWRSLVGSNSGNTPTNGANWTTVADKAGAYTWTGTHNWTQNATFAGNVSLADNKILLLGTSNDYQLYHDGGNSVQANSTGSVFYTNTSVTGSHIFSTNSTTALTLDSSQNATFAGNITSVGASAFGQSYIAYSDNSAVNWARLDVDNVNATGNLVLYQDQTGQSVIRQDHATASLAFATAGGTNALILDSSQNATFAGNITKGTQDVQSINVIEDSAVVTGNYTGSAGAGANVTELNKSGLGARTITLDESTFNIGDKVVVRRLLATAGVITVTTDTGTITLPDGTSAASHTMSGDAFTATFHKIDATNWIVTVGK